MDLRDTQSLTHQADLFANTWRRPVARLWPPRDRRGEDWFGLPRAFQALSRIVAGCAAASSITGAALAQDANYSSVEATPDKPVQLTYHASVHKNSCSPAPLPSIRIIEAPKGGVLTVRKASLTTNKVAGCPNLKTPAQVVFYTARTGFLGPDHVKYEVTLEDGTPADYDVTITVKAGEPTHNAPAQEGTRPL